MSRKRHISARDKLTRDERNAAFVFFGAVMIIVLLVIFAIALAVT